MKYLFTGDLGNITVQVHSDPDMFNKVACHIWSYAEFAQLTGITVPDDVESFALEYHRGIAAIKMEDELEGEGFDSLNDAPQFMQDLWTNRDKLRKHMHAGVREVADIGYSYHYDEAKDEIIRTEEPDKDHQLALKEIGRTNTPTRLLFDLIQILVDKGTVSEDDLPDYFNRMKALADQINWDEL